MSEELAKIINDLPVKVIGIQMKSPYFPFPGDEIRIFDTCPVCNKKIYKHIHFAHCKQNHLFNGIEGKLYKRIGDHPVTYCERIHEREDQE